MRSTNSRWATAGRSRSSSRDRTVRVRDYGRGIPLGKVLECVSVINTGAKYDSETFQKAVGLNGVGQKAVNALSVELPGPGGPRGRDQGGGIRPGQAEEGPPHRQDRRAQRHHHRLHPGRGAVRPGLPVPHRVHRGHAVELRLPQPRADPHAQRQAVQVGERPEGPPEKKLSGETLYPIIHLEGDDIEVALTHGAHYGEEYYSFVNGQHTTMGGTHLAAFREAVVETVRNFYKKDFDAADVRQSIVAAISVRVIEPVFESQTKTKLGSNDIGPGRALHPGVRRQVRPAEPRRLPAQATRDGRGDRRKIEESERERKELAGIRSLARERAKKASLHNRKLRDCRLHLGDHDERAEESTLFIVEGDSAAGSLTACRDVQTQAVFALKGKPLNTYGLSKKVIYENEEFHLLQSALNIEESLDGLRYNKVVIATDADVDGMHIRLLLISFFLQFFPDIIRHGHLFILDTPLFRVRNKRKTLYCYSEQEKAAAIAELGAGHEITRFKGLGEISAGEFKDFIGENIRLAPVNLHHLHSSDELLAFFMGKNTPERQDFIIGNLRVEKDLVDAWRRHDRMPRKNPFPPPCPGRRAEAAARPQLPGLVPRVRELCHPGPRRPAHRRRAEAGAAADPPHALGDGRRALPQGGEHRRGHHALPSRTATPRSAPRWSAWGSAAFSSSRRAISATSSPATRRRPPAISRPA